MSAPMPTAPGWWWRGKVDRPAGHMPIKVLEVDGELKLDGTPPCVWPVEDWEGWWLAPIPSPAVCEALAAYRAAVYARDDEGEALARRGRAGGRNRATVLKELVEEMEYCAEVLADVLRIERDGEA